MACQAIILCGHGTGLASSGSTPKGLVDLCGRFLVEYAISMVQDLSPRSVILFVAPRQQELYSAALSSKYPFLSVMETSDAVYGSTATQVADVIDPCGPPVLVLPCDLVGGPPLRATLDAVLDGSSAAVLLDLHDRVRAATRFPYPQASAKGIWAAVDTGGNLMYYNSADNIVAEDPPVIQSAGLVGDSMIYTGGALDLATFAFDARFLHRLGASEFHEYWEGVGLAPPTSIKDDLIPMMVLLSRSQCGRILCDNDWKTRISNYVTAGEDTSSAERSPSVHSIMVASDKYVYRVCSDSALLTMTGLLNNPVRDILARTVPVIQHPTDGMKVEGLKDTYIQECHNADPDKFQKQFQGKQRAVIQRSQIMGDICVGAKTRIIECRIAGNVTIGNNVKIERSYIMVGPIPDGVQLTNCMITKRGHLELIEAKGHYVGLGLSDNCSVAFG